MKTDKEKLKDARMKLRKIRKICKQASKTDWFHTSYTQDIIKISK
jgi:5-bromo-4-chloroindolyl phosphate hydrolysis protein